MKEFLINFILDPLFIKAFISVICIFIINYFFHVIKTKVIMRISEARSRYNATKLLMLLSYLVILTVIAIIYSDQLKGFSITLGLIGAIVAFAFKNMLSSIAGWISITFGKYFKVGDRIQVNNIKGDVIDVNFFTTTLIECREWIDSDLYTGRLIKISNNDILNSPLYNYSADFPFLWDEIKIPIRYGSDIPLAKQIFLDAALDITNDFAQKSNAIWLKLKTKYLLEETNTSPKVTLKVNSNWIEFTIRYIVDYKKRRKIQNLIFTKILEEIEKVPDKIQFASATFELVAMPDLNINTKGLNH